MAIQIDDVHVQVHQIVVLYIVLRWKMKSHAILVQEICRVAFRSAVLIDTSAKKSLSNNEYNIVFYMMHFTESCRPNTLLRRSGVVQTLYYPNCFHVLISSLSYCGMENEKSRNISVYKGNLQGSIQVCRTHRYLIVNQLKNPFQMNII